MKVIIIEDEDISREGLVKVIKKANKHFDVIGEADNGEDGIELIRKLKPDVVITDIKMPKLDGLDMLKQLKDEGVNILSVIISGFSEFELTQKAIRLGVIDYLRKPILIEEIEELLDRIYLRFIKQYGFSQDEVVANIINTKNYSFFVNKTIRFIQANYAKRLYLEEIADKFKVTSGYLGLIFHKETGLAFSKFVKLYRINIAKNELVNNKKKIYEVAQRVGYEDPRYFCRVFKQVTGASATDYIKDNIS